jgi:hypothetical protein
MAEGVLGGILGEEDEVSKVEASENLSGAGAEAFADKGTTMAESGEVSGILSADAEPPSEGISTFLDPTAAAVP